MPQLAGFRGVVAAPSRVAEAIAASGDVAKGLAGGAFVQDPTRAVYRYDLTFPGAGGRPATRRALVCAVRLAPWTDSSVRRHEVTLAPARDEALARIRANRGHTAAVLAGYRDPTGEVDRMLRRSDGSRHTVELTTADGCQHRLWRLADAELIGKLRHHFAPKDLHVLDTPDRYEAMLAYQDELAGAHALAMYSSANYGLAYLVNVDDPTLAMAARHRIVRGASAKRDAVLAAVTNHFIIDKLDGAAKDAARVLTALRDTVAHQPALIAVFAGEPDAWKLTLKPDVSPVAEGAPVHRAVQKLDPLVVEHLFVARALAGAELTPEPDAAAALAAVGGGADAALLLRPLTIDKLLHTGELGQLLPARSTAVHPPIVDGLVNLLIDPDEDLV